jgi:hypothetical protein
MKHFLLSLSLLLVFHANTVVFADSYRQFALKHRDAQLLHSRLLPLLSDDLALVADGNSLLVRGPAAEVNNLVALIKKLDRPRQQLKISIYRGEDPSVSENPFADKHWSTKLAQNRWDEIIIEEETVFTITETAVLKQTLADYRHESQLKSQRHSLVGQSQTIYQTSDYRLNINTTQVAASLLANGKVSVDATFSLPKGGDSRPQGDEQQQHLQTRFTRILPVGQWARLASHQGQAHRPPISSQRKVYSTQSKRNFVQEIWLKIETLKQ